MQPLIPFFREAGAGPGVVCLHSNASTSSQWRTLMELLAPRFYVLAADSLGAGRSPASSLGVAQLLTQALPRVEVVEFAGVGHMGPITHP